MSKIRTQAQPTQTYIDRASCSTLRSDMNKALRDVLDKHGLQATLGRITFEPGRQLRCKLTVIQPALDASPSEKPKVGERWVFGNKTYKITSVGENEVIGSRPVATRWAGQMDRNYRIKMSAILLHGIKVR